LKILLAVVLVLIAVIVGGALVAGPDLGGTLAMLRPEPKRTPVRLETVEARPLVQTVMAPGRIEPRTKVEVSAEVSARIMELPFEAGAEVRKGQLIVKLDDRDLKAILASTKARREGEGFRLEGERARLRGLQATLEFARRELERQRALYDTGDVSRKDLEDAEERAQDLQSSVDTTLHAISQLEASLVAAEAEIEQAEAGLANTTIEAPMDGVITEVNAEVGELVLVGTMNNPASVILTIANLDRMLLNAEVSESDIAKVAEGQGARVHINAYPDEVFSGTVTRVALQRTGNPDGSGYFRTEVEITLQGRRIQSGLMANVDIEIATHEGITVPSQAVVERAVEDVPDRVREGNPYIDATKKTTNVVYRVVDGKATCTPVKTGPSDLTHTLITGGLNAGDVVITGPYKALEKVKHDELVKDEKDEKASGHDEGASAAGDDSGGGGGVRVRVR
jgi:HlyD family secretion protein